MNIDQLLALPIKAKLTGGKVVESYFDSLGEYIHSNDHRGFLAVPSQEHKDLLDGYFLVLGRRFDILVDSSVHYIYRNLTWSK